MLFTFILSFISFITLIIFKGINFTYLNSLYDFISFKTLALLSMFIAVNKSLELIGAFKLLAFYVLNKITKLKTIAILLILICFFSSMLVTNDVALLCFVPFSIYLLKELKAKKFTMQIIILQTIAANLGSMLTPFGNPQNLFIFTYFHLDFLSFFKSTYIYCFISLILLFIFTINIKNKNIKLKNLIKTQINQKLFIQNLALFFISILCVSDILNIFLGFFVVFISLFISNKNAIFKADFSLIIIFINLFIFVKNISYFISIKEFDIFYLSIFLSWIISNVPACVFLASFTNDYKELLLGVNIGSLGTLIASMASLISYKYYINSYKNKAFKYIINFTWINIVFLIILVVFKELSRI